MIILRVIVFVFAAVALAGCCVSGIGCTVPVEGPVAAWDGQGPPPVEDAAPPPQQPQQLLPKKKMVRPKPDVTVGSIKQASGATKREFQQWLADRQAAGDAKPKTEQQWAEKDAADRDADAKLKKQLMICRDCLPAARNDDTTASAKR